MNPRTLLAKIACTLLAMLTASIAAAENGPGGDSARHLEPFFDEQTCLVVAIALPATVGEDYLAKVAGWLEHVRPNSREDANEARLAMAALVRAGARNVYLVVSLADVPDGSPLLVIPAENEGAAEPIIQLLRDQGLAAERSHEVILGGDREIVDRVKQARPVARPEIGAALSAVENGAIGVCFTPSEDQRQVFSAMLPRLPSEFGGGSTQVLAAGCRWATLNLDLEKLTLRLVIQSADDPAAAALRGVWSEVVQRACRHPDVIGAMPGIDKPSDLLTPALDGNRLILQLSDQDRGLAALGAALRFPLALSRSAAHRGASRLKLLTLGLALQTLSDRKGMFPTTTSYSEDGKPLLSWRVFLLPLLGEEHLARQFHLDEPWDSEHNSALIKQMPEVYLRPGAPSAGDGRTPFVAAIGDGTALSAAKPTSLRDFRDFTSTTIMVVEADADHEVVWTQPTDLDYDASQPLRGLTNVRLGGFTVLFADGTTRFLPNDIDLATLRALFTRAGGESVDLDE